MGEILWVTGAQVSIVSASFMKENFSNVSVRDTSELLGGDRTVTAANGIAAYYTKDGWNWIYTLEILNTHFRSPC